AKNNYLKLIPLDSIRGSIYDRNREVLAYDKATFNISVIPYQIKREKTHLFKEISESVGYEENRIHKNYKKNFQNFFSPVDIILNIDKTGALNLKERFEGKIVINPQPQRYYPYPYQFSHLLGYVKRAFISYEKLKKYGYSPLERVGFFGLEQSYDTYLKGEDGGDLIEIDAKGRVVGYLGKRAPKRGKDIQLTIDRDIQNIASDSLSGKKGVLILMGSETGAILALNSFPSFNPNCFIKGKNTEKFLKSRHSPMLNRAINATYP
ncbi:unnamed protein product, partial [marine sediment metagenome]